ncbi:MAG TPA: HlyD family secretion protein [Candidatus Baltobacteraceae bacterium]|jgi:membrane fusion protein (multidrug efflux system)|nr:HlyD family secretion protein [Candidatus Baltobacteraceae bacterium]
MDEKPAATPASPASPPPVRETSSVPPPPKKGRRALAIIVTLAALIVIALAVAYYIHFIAPYETTDDAFVTANAAYISARVSGPVVRLLIDDNQMVKTGDPLLEIDDSDYQTQVALTRANLISATDRVLQARAQIVVDQAKADQQQAYVAGAQAIADRTEADRIRYLSVQSNAVSRSQFDLAQTSATSASADVEVARDQAKAAVAQVDLDRAELETATAQVGQAEASLRQAQLNLSYTKVLAPRDGRVTHRTVERGAYVEVGEALLAIVPDYVWVVANFKETQLEHMRPGQPVSIRFDAYPKREFKAKVDSLQAGSGASFSLLPPENAIGNYVKVVQRVPVKIVFDEPLNEPGLDIAPGMSVEPKVRVK